MRWLFVSDFVADENSGAAGSLLAIGRALQRAGHAVDFEWKDGRPYRLRHPTAARLIELPGRQRRQVEARLRGAAYDVVTISQPFAYGVYERVAPRYPGTLFLNRTHGWEARAYEAQRQFAWDGGRSSAIPARVSAALTRRACRRAARAAHAVVAPSTRCAEWIRRSCHLPAERVAAIPYGLDTEFAASGPRTPGRSLRLLYVGNYLPMKGSAVLEAVLPDLGRRFTDATLTFVVDEAARERVLALYRPAFGDRVTALPWLERRRLAAVYGSHDVLLYPSLFEGFGKTWLEAMACGVCVVGFAEGGLPDVARHGEHALFCPTGDADGLRALLVRVHDAPADARAIGERARARAREFTWERTARETAAFAERVAAAR